MIELIKKERRNKIIIVVAIIMFILLSFFTLTNDYYGSTDVKSFTSVAKYFSGDYPAKLRGSHSYLWGWANQNEVGNYGFIAFKISNLSILIFLILSIYHISGKRKETLLLFAFSPIVWFMGSWINSIQVASLCFLWCYYFMREYEKNESNYRCLVLSGISFGLAVALWHGVLLFGFFFMLIYFWDKQLIDSINFLLWSLIGLMPLLILDSIIFGFPFHSIIKNISGTILNSLGQGLYQNIGFFNIWNGIFFLAFLPLFFWRIYRPTFLEENIRITIFITTCMLIIFFMNPQIRYAFFLMPLILVNIDLKGRTAKYLIYSSVLIIGMVFIPYMMYENPQDKIEQDLNLLVADYPNQVFVVGNHPDDYDILANAYWGDQVKEFVSIQDYRGGVDYQVNFISTPEFQGRREIYLNAGMRKPSNDLTDYNSIKYGISFEDNLNISGFEYIRSYGDLRLFEIIEMGVEDEK